jgi:hypothetical protein
MIRRFVLSLSVEQTIKVREVGGGADVQTGDVQKAQCYYVAEEMTVRQKTRRHVHEVFTVRRNSGWRHGSSTSDFIRNRTSPLPTPVIEKNYVAHQEMCYITVAINMWTVIHRRLKV